MRVLMVGAGSVGGFIGAHLAHAGVAVSFLLRARTCEAIRSRGITLRSGSTSFTVHPPVATDPSKLATPDVIMLGVKCYDLDEVIQQISPILKKNTFILTFQNGVDTEERLMAAFEGDRVVAGVIYIYTRIAEPGVIDHLAQGQVTIGELSGNTETPRITALLDLFANTPIPCKVSGNMTRVKWEKMCWNVVFNPLTVLLNDSVAKALDHDETLSLITEIVKETMLVAERFGVTLPPDTAHMVVRNTQAVRDIHTSMFDDWKAGRQTEIEYLNGYLVRHALTFGVAIPVNETLYCLVKARTARMETTHGPGQDTKPAMNA
ncbi:MAG TPA: 2-dehydropantoate 2-reductase [Nitrospirales bacterium]|nr:2-dehydropantoate 2-reductase [Nitrospirales bacterium]